MNIVIAYRHTRASEIPLFAGFGVVFAARAVELLSLAQIRLTTLAKLVTSSNGRHILRFDLLRRMVLPVGIGSNSNAFVYLIS